MIRSMTGFGEASLESRGIHYSVEIRSLNNKYFKAVIRLADELQGLEPEIEADLRRRLTRGTVTMLGKYSDSSGAAAYEINHHALGRYIEQVRKAPQIAGGEVRFDVGALLALPGVLQPPADEQEKLDHARAAYMTLLSQACDKLIQMRRREGALLHADLMQHHALISERLARISERAPGVVEDYHQRLRVRVETMLKDAGVTCEPADLIREVAVYAERSDIAEEIARLSGHMAQFNDLLAAADGKATGRTLDFLAQEMLREANTIASKCNDAAISRDIVEVKGAIDRIKEQVQNVE